METDQVYEAAMAEATKLGLMTKNGEATDRCHYTVCGEVFSTVGNFDRHRGGSACHPPAEVGLVQHVQGWWLQPGPDVPWAPFAGHTATVGAPHRLLRVPRPQPARRRRFSAL